MAIKFELNASMRKDVGKGASRRLRREAGLVPAIIYGAKQPATNISLTSNKVWHALEKESFYSSILTINLDGKTEQVILKDIQRHPFKKIILHMDFLRVKADEEMQISVPLHFLNEEFAKGVKVGGGQISRQMNEVEISCLPADLPEYIDVDLSDLDLDETIHLSDLKLPKNVKLSVNLDDEENNLPVVAIHSMKEETEEESAPASVETEITTEKKTDESAEGGEKK